jgi:hypothetical protein
MSKEFYTRSESAAYLSEKGLPTTKNTLQKLATVGGGPDYSIWGNKALSTPSQLDTWAEQKLRPAKRSTSDK